MKFKHEYQLQITIDQPIEVVTSLYVNRQTMHLWEKGLIQIIDEKNQLFQEDSSGYLVFSLNEFEMKMKTTVISNKLPDEITIIYEVPGAWNQCINRFIADHEKTKWTMDVIFEMETETFIPKERFIEKTMQAMNIYKEFVETYE